MARASNLGVATVKRVRDGTCIANRRTLKAIISATQGEVTMTDLLSVAVESDDERSNATSSRVVAPISNMERDL